MGILDSIQGTGRKVVPADEAIHAFLLIGQSNMAGRGQIDPAHLLMDDRCVMLRMGRWQQMVEPINVDRCVFPGHGPQSGANLATTFAIRCAETQNVRVGLIPCADGGTRLSQWMPGEALFEHAVFQTRLACRTAVLSGILWHQGESDYGPELDLDAYKRDLVAMMHALRHQVGDVPIVLGELGYAEQGFRPAMKPHIDRFNAALPDMARSIGRCAVASAEGLPCRGDELHFSTEALRTFGRRYWDVFANLVESSRQA